MTVEYSAPDILISRASAQVDALHRRLEAVLERLRGTEIFTERRLDHRCAPRAEGHFGNVVGHLSAAEGTRDSMIGYQGYHHLCKSITHGSNGKKCLHPEVCILIKYVFIVHDMYHKITTLYI